MHPCIRCLLSEAFFCMSDRHLRHIWSLKICPVKCLCVCVRESDEVFQYKIIFVGASWIGKKSLEFKRYPVYIIKIDRHHTISGKSSKRLDYYILKGIRLLFDTAHGDDGLAGIILWEMEIKYLKHVRKTYMLIILTALSSHDGDTQCIRTQYETR